MYLLGVVQGWCPKCTALYSNLNGPGGKCLQAHTQGLAKVLNSKVLWDEYSIDDDITVCSFSQIYLLPLTNLSLI